MGQRLFFPPNVAGWPGGLTWLDGQAVVARANFAAWLTEPSTWVGHDPFAGLAGRQGWRTPQDSLEALATLMLPEVLEPSGRVFCQHPAADHRLIARRLLALPEPQIG